MQSDPIGGGHRALGHHSLISGGAGAPRPDRGSAGKPAEGSLSDPGPRPTVVLYSARSAVLRLPDKYRRRLRTTNTLERLIQELRRREKVVRIFPNDESAWRLLGAFLAETHEDWSTGRRYFRMEEYFRWKQKQAAEEGIQPAA